MAERRARRRRVRGRLRSPASSRSSTSARAGKNASQANQKGRTTAANPAARDRWRSGWVADASLPRHPRAPGRKPSRWRMRGNRTVLRLRPYPRRAGDTGFSYEYWHLNSADCWRGATDPQAPHSDCPAWSLAYPAPAPDAPQRRRYVPRRWRGWYAAIADIANPAADEAAPWQRAPAERADENHHCAS